jgi:hypothetical protein
VRVLLDHPMTDRFDRNAFEAGLSEAGLHVVASRELLGRFAWFVAERPAVS